MATERGTAPTRARDGDVAGEGDASDSCLHRARFSSERRTFDSIHDDRDLAPAIDEARRLGGAHLARQRLLSDAVRIDTGVVPDLAKAFRDVAERAQIEEPLEAYVHVGAEINAAVVPARDRKIVVLSSGAIERLEHKELDFVIGHELGHALFGHLDLPAGFLIEGAGGTSVEPRQARQLLAWKRQGEISADRAGLICCGGLEVAAQALFKTISGLNVPGFQVDPDEFAKQWDDLAQEVRSDAAGDYWKATHPFPPLRMRALIAFWKTDRAKEMLTDAPGGTPLEQADRAIDRDLALMDPLSRDSTDGDESAGGDPLLADFFLWGGLYVAAADGRIDPSELRAVRALVGRDKVDRTMAEVKPSKTTYRERFQAARDARRKPLTALELHAIFSGLAGVAIADGVIDPKEIKALHALAKVCGVSKGFVDGLLPDEVDDDSDGYSDYDDA